MRDTCGLPASRGRGHTAVQREMRNHLPNTTQKEPVWQPLRGYSRARSRERPGRAGHPTVQEQPMSGRVPPRPWVIPMCNTEAFEARTGGYPVRNFCWNSSMWYPSHAPPKEQASWLLGFARRRDHPMAWRVGDRSQTCIALPHFEWSRPWNHHVSWEMLGNPEEFVHRRGSADHDQCIFISHEQGKHE